MWRRFVYFELISERGVGWSFILPFYGMDDSLIDVIILGFKIRLHYNGWVVLDCIELTQVWETNAY